MTDHEAVAKVLNIKTLPLPKSPKVAEIRWRPYVDSLGDEALRLRVILAEDTADDARHWPALEPIERAIRDALLKAGINLFPYIQYAKKSELVEAGVEI